MLYNKGNHAQLKRVQPQPSRLQGENGGKIYSTLSLIGRILTRRSRPNVYQA